MPASISATSEGMPPEAMTGGAIRGGISRRSSLNSFGSSSRLDQAKADLAHVSAAIAIFEGNGEGLSPRPYVDTDRLFARGEPIALAKAALSSNGPMDTLELVIHIMAAKGLDTGGKVLAKAIAFRMIHALRQQWRGARGCGEAQECNNLGAARNRK
jgi:hypothetical protein